MSQQKEEQRVMNVRDDRVKERIAFLGQEPDQLRQVRGQELYTTLGELGLTHGQYFRALDTNLADYCAQEFGINLDRVTVERFFQSDPNAKWLFPDIVRDAVLTGMRTKPRYPELIIRDETVPGAAYDVPYVKESADEEELRHVAEGAAIPESAITYGNRVVRLEKRGRGVLASYEVVRRMSVDMLRVHLQRMGERLGRDLDSRLCHVLVHGDASGPETAAEVVSFGGPELRYSDLVNGFMTLTLDHYFTPTHLLADAAMCKDILDLEEFKEGMLFDFAKTGNLPTPLGVRLIPMADQPSNAMTMLDAGYAVHKLTEQDLLVESDKLIHQQWDRTYMTVVTDFAIAYEKARVVIGTL